MLYLLDSNIVSHIARDPLGPAAVRAILLGYEQLCTSIIVACEIRYGLEKNRTYRAAAQITALLDKLSVLPFEQPAEETYGKLRAALEAKGKPIGTFDMLIAAHALALDCTLVTANIREFERVEGLRLENWIR